ncbi:flagellar hook-length control protein FliK [Dechloromonas sp. XY25]|uniref:Flagellar hook-length control protein FliK n=1 Tax=Dechloromonas hankyongensis TaxID=2908002 RepID=A0ABS9K6R7_9RHOO|nr:flagellar hook-length control protein FliK [Dechloromonas hankyongensis]MCG2578866.1 flagellar hook-length control protein FliK [Dechloromonas hankyongensis]
MIPADVASRLRLAVQEQPTAPQAISPSKNLTDVLSELVPGQRVMAEIMALLPNGAYRALVAQREITLALPFSAKAGDSLELEVVDNDGKLALAVVGNQSSSQSSATSTDSVATTLSQTGRLIGDLLGEIGEQGKKASPAPLNGNAPLVDKFPANAADLAPILRDALSKSGVFYEAHQARWAAGELPTERLLQEPQGKHSPVIVETARFVANTIGNASEPATASMNAAAAGSTSESSAAATRLPTSPPQISGIPADLTPLVQQQLDALATQTFAWQGQAWPGQEMRWEIDDQAQRNSGDGERDQWRTRLKLQLPSLGGIDATLRLQPGGQVDIALTASSREGETRLGAASIRLQEQFEAAGLKLVQFSIKHDSAES